MQAHWMRLLCRNGLGESFLPTLNLIVPPNLTSGPLGDSQDLKAKFGVLCGGSSVASALPICSLLNFPPSFLPQNNVQVAEQNRNQPYLWFVKYAISLSSLCKKKKTLLKSNAFCFIHNNSLCLLHDWGILGWIHNCKPGLDSLCLMEHF